MRKPRFTAKNENDPQGKKNLVISPTGSHSHEQEPFLTRPGTLDHQGTGLYERPPFAAQSKGKAGLPVEHSGQNIPFTLITPPPEHPPTSWINRMKNQRKVHHAKH